MCRISNVEEWKKISGKTWDVVFVCFNNLLTNKTLSHLRSNLSDFSGELNCCNGLGRRQEPGQELINSTSRSWRCRVEVLRVTGGPREMINGNIVDGWKSFMGWRRYGCMMERWLLIVDVGCACHVGPTVFLDSKIGLNKKINTLITKLLLSKLC